MTNERMQLLRDAADDCESEANNLLNQAPNMGPTKERSYRRQADECIARATALRAWADSAQSEPKAPLDAGLRHSPVLVRNTSLDCGFEAEMEQAHDGEWVHISIVSGS